MATLYKRNYCLVKNKKSTRWYAPWRAEARTTPKSILPAGGGRPIRSVALVEIAVRIGEPGRPLTVEIGQRARPEDFLGRHVLRQDAGGIAQHDPFSLIS